MRCTLCTCTLSIWDEWLFFCVQPIKSSRRHICSRSGCGDVITVTRRSTVSNSGGAQQSFFHWRCHCASWVAKLCHWKTGHSPLLSLKEVNLLSFLFQTGNWGVNNEAQTSGAHHWRIWIGSLCLQTVFTLRLELGNWIFRVLRRFTNQKWALKSETQRSRRSQSNMAAACFNTE